MEIPPDDPDQAEPAGPGRAALWRRAALLAVCLLVLVLGAAWLMRRDLADRVIAGQLRDLGLPATYQVEAIGPARQVLRKVVIGDPARPDLTVDRVEIDTTPRFGVPIVNRIVLDRPRLYASYHDGRLSLGSLDRLRDPSSTEPFRLPRLDLTIRDGRARVQTDFGPAGIKLEGGGALRDGFAGKLAVVAPALAGAGCKAAGATLFGGLTIAAERPRFSGPVRLGHLDCAARHLHAAQLAAMIEARPAADFRSGGVSAQVTSGPLRGEGAEGQAGRGMIDLLWSDTGLSGRYNVTGTGIKAGPFAARTLGATGTVTRKSDSGAIEGDGTISGTDLRPGPQLDAALAGAEDSAKGSFAAGMIAQIRTALARETPGSTLSANLLFRRNGAVTSMMVPAARLTGSSGATLLGMSRVAYFANGAGPQRLSGNVATGGPDLPRISGRLDQAGGGDMRLQMALADYRGGGGHLAIPELVVVRKPGGAIGLAGRAMLSGPLPGGAAEGLGLPIEGNWTPTGRLALWHGCVPVRFERLAYANLTLERRGLTLCSGANGAIVRFDARGIRLAAGTAGLDLAGRLGETPLKLSSGPVGFAIPGTLSARQLGLVLGEGEGAARFTLDRLTAKIGAEIDGTFAQTDAELAAVPLNLRDASGTWRFADGRLAIAGAAFRLEDRQADKRFNPLVGKAATLLLADNRITARTDLAEPDSGLAIAQASIRHDLGSGTGSADLLVPGITFDDHLQPGALTHLADGVIALAKGTVRGSGRIDWNVERVSSNGSFSTDSFDFAALFGPVKGASGTIHFTDLLGLVTAPDERLKVASINPGIEVTDGELSYALQGGGVLQVNGGHWPFMGGTLSLQPTRMAIGSSEVRRLTLNVERLDAAIFVQRLDLSNLNATGVFDGRLPLVFDENGGRIEGGALVARPPGGNLSYLGELTYKDLSAMGNFAFDALRSLDYRGMRIDLDGSLAGEIVTRVAFDGIRQGARTRQNFLTRQVARLPLQFRVNVRAPFFGLFSSFSALYDPAKIRNPRDVGLLDPALPAPPIQPPVSESKP